MGSLFILLPAFADGQMGSNESRAQIVSPPLALPQTPDD